MKNFAIARHLPWVLPILAMILITPFTPWLDLKISHFFYDSQTGFENNAFFTFLFNWGTWPAMLVAIISSFIFGLSWYIPEWAKWRREALILILTMLIGAGLIVHLILKDHWGRPRPKQVIEFGGSQQYRPIYEPNFFLQPEPSKGFPCGHCTMGFYFFALALVGLRLRNREMVKWGILLTVVLGLLLSYTRIAQGGHFFSDTLISALIMWLTAFALYRWIPKYERVK